MAKTQTRTKQSVLAEAIHHRDGCPGERVEEYDARRPKSDQRPAYDVTVARCIDCGEAVVGEGDA